MKIAVVGAGGVGGYFGGKISSSGYDVTFVARGEHLKAMREKGLKVNSILGDFSVSRAQATDDYWKHWESRSRDPGGQGLAGQRGRPAHERARRRSDDHSAPAKRDHGRRGARRSIRDKNIIGGLCRIISRIESPGVIRHSGLEPFIAFGELDHRKTDRIGNIKRMFDAAGIVSRIADDIHAELWSKFMAICVSGLLAVTRSTYGRVRELPETRVLMRELLREIHVVASKAGQALDPDIVEKTMALIDSYPYESNSSLTRDVMEGRPSEIEYQNGTVVRLGRQYGVDVPVNRFIYSSILPMESAARAKADI